MNRKLMIKSIIEEIEGQGPPPEYTVEIEKSDMLDFAQRKLETRTKQKWKCCDVSGTIDEKIYTFVNPEGRTATVMVGCKDATSD